MKNSRWSILILLVLVCLATGIASAQDATSEAPPPNLVIQVPAPFYTSPVSPMNACSDTTKATEICDLMATSPKDIVGIWTIYFQAQPAFIQFKADGTWLIAGTAQDTNAATIKKFPYGTYSFDENGLFNSADLSPDATVAQECVNDRYLLHVIKMGTQPLALNRVVIDDCFAPRWADWAFTGLWVGSE
jgi:hypothetical protein